MNIYQLKILTLNVWPVLSIYYLVILCMLGLVICFDMSFQINEKSFTSTLCYKVVGHGKQLINCSFPL